MQNVHITWSHVSSHFNLYDLWTLKIKGSIHKKKSCPVRGTGVWVPLFRSLCWFESSPRPSPVRTWYERTGEVIRTHGGGVWNGRPGGLCRTPGNKRPQLGASVSSSTDTITYRALPSTEARLAQRPSHSGLPTGVVIQRCADQNQREQDRRNTAWTRTAARLQETPL